jgi:hypothetical protein
LHKSSYPYKDDTSQGDGGEEFSGANTFEYIEKESFHKPQASRLHLAVSLLFIRALPYGIFITYSRK